MWRFTDDNGSSPQERIEAALDAGITLFDTAAIYGFDGSDGFGGAETLLGTVFGEAPNLRDKIVLATKGGIEPGVPYDSSTDYLNTSLTASMQRLGVDHVELFQVHRPDVLTHPEELADTLQNMVESGKVGAVGVSNFTQAQISALQHYLDIPLATTQPEFSPLNLSPLQNGEFDQAMQNNMAILAWSPLGGGRIANAESTRERSVALRLDSAAKEFGVSRAVAAFSWIAAHPARPIPIIGSQTPARIAEAADIAKVGWTRQGWYEVLQAAMGEKLP
ncbi:aldo/keto reductase [Pontixanthobacter aestiaquae]|uniref:Aldo/keto reductase n=2 Tax=Pontixanthobacter aestiaquae TaxID=1509367 RepID=A0A844Z1H4_9SPHN|nr:aldo/keto reductase [Pontixanthobacter aestiaquae]MDN3647239.1 aldo/keto reductase [Pontixanthobacter aestiaquae]MXO81785.1 aldo/keto reductase [Pontixanthobacter aestiaquae]